MNFWSCFSIWDKGLYITNVSYQPLEPSVHASGPISNKTVGKRQESPSSTDVCFFFFFNFGHFFTSPSPPAPPRIAKVIEDGVTVATCPPDVEKVPIWAKNSNFKFYGLQENRPGWYGAVPRVLLADLGRRKGPCHFGNAPQTVGKVRKHSYKHNKVCLTLFDLISASPWFPKFGLPRIYYLPRWKTSHLAAQFCATLLWPLFRVGPCRWVPREPN